MHSLSTLLATRTVGSRCISGSVAVASPIPHHRYHSRRDPQASVVTRDVADESSWGKKNITAETQRARPVYALSFSCGFPQVLFAASDSGVFNSIDMGENWEMVKEGTFRSVETGRPKFGHVYAGAEDGKLWRSTDGGSTWEIYNNSRSHFPLIGMICKNEKYWEWRRQIAPCYFPH